MSGMTCTGNNLMATQNSDKPVLGIIVPCYNEEDVVAQTFEALSSVQQRLIRKDKISAESFIAFVDDGSEDRTWELIEDLRDKAMCVKALKLAGNFGHQNALLSGLFTFLEEADCLISIDADLQDDINVIETMVDRFHEAYEVVYGVRRSREN